MTEAPAARTFRIHFIAYNALPQTTPAKERPYVLPGLMEDKPFFRAPVTLDDRIRRASALNRSTYLARRDQELEAVIQDTHEVLTLRY